MEDLTKSATINVRVRPNVKAAAVKAAQADRRSLASWLELLIEAETLNARQRKKAPAD